MKKGRIFVGIAVLALFLVSCKASKCDCPSFSPKKRGDMLKVNSQYDIHTEMFNA